MKTTTISLLTDFQVQELERLGLILWPGEGLELAELCRRVLLNGADGMRNGGQESWKFGRQLLEPENFPRG